MPGMRYDETESDIGPGSNVLLYSDGLIEAHDGAREMFGFDRLREAMRIDDAGSELLDRLLETLHAFTGTEHEQEDDITLVTLRRAAGVADRAGPRGSTALTALQPARRRPATSARRWTGWQPRWPTSASTRAPGTAQDRGQRDRDERHRIRQPGSRGRPVRRRGRGDPRRRSSSASPTTPCRARSRTTPRTRTSSASSPASRSRAAGASSSSSTWSTRWT